MSQRGIALTAKKLSAKQARFVDEYLVDFNAVDAARRAGYAENTATRQGHRILEYPPVQAEIQRRQADLREESADEAGQVRRELIRLGLFDARKLFDAEGHPLPITELDDATAAAIQGVEVVTIGNRETGVGTVVKYRIADKNAALDKLMKHFGLYEADNRQASDPLAEVLREIDGQTKGL